MYSPRKQKQYELLAMFAQNKELYQTELEEKLGISYRNVIRHLQTLEKDGLIESKLVPSEKQGPGRKLWSLTFKGLIYTFQILTIKQVKQIINTHSSMLLTFKKWPLFREAGLEPFMVERLREVVLTVSLFGEVSPIAFDAALFAVALEPERDKINVPFIKVCKLDQELTEFANEIFAKEEADCKRFLKRKEIWDSTV